MLRVGTATARRGFVVPAHCVLGRWSVDIERILGFPPGRLEAGYVLLALACRPLPHQFELRAHSDPVHGLPESMFVADAFREADGRPNAAMIKEQVSTEMAVTSGPHRIVKVVPNMGLAPGEDFVPSREAPAWELTVDLPFDIVARTERGEMVVHHYDGSFFAGTPAAIEAEGERFLAERRAAEAWQ